jgi:hypothetical protein
MWLNSRVPAGRYTRGTGAVTPLEARPALTRWIRALAGLPLADLRATVLERLRGPLGCTHLNDMLRALAGVPGLVGQLSPELQSLV